jgi:hypothetical protein
MDVLVEFDCKDPVHVQAGAICSKPVPVLSDEHINEAATEYGRKMANADVKNGGKGGFGVANRAAFQFSAGAKWAREQSA